MSFNIFPEKIVKTKETSGGLISEVYDINTWRDIGFLGVVFVTIIIGIFAPVLGGLILVYQCLTKRDGDEGLNILSILASIYILIDIKKGWIISTLMTLFYDSTELKYVININAALIISNVILLIFGGTIFNLFGRYRFAHLVLCTGITYLCYLFSNGIVNNIIKIH